MVEAGKTNSSRHNKTTPYQLYYDFKFSMRRIHITESK